MYNSIGRPLKQAGTFFIMACLLVTPTLAQLSPMVEIRTNRTVIPEGTSATISFNADASIAPGDSIVIDLSASGDEQIQTRISLEPASVTLSANAPKTEVILTVINDQDAHLHDISFGITFAHNVEQSSVSPDLSRRSLDFIVPPNDLEASYQDPITFQSQGKTKD